MSEKNNQEQNDQEQKVSKRERIVNHLKEHKTTYICAAAGAVAGAAVGVVVGVSLRSPKMPEINVPIVNNNTPVFNNINTNTMGGYSTKLVECVETGQIWKTVKDAAEAAGVSATTMSGHLNGRQDHISGLHYTIIGLGSTGN